MKIDFGDNIRSEEFRDGLRAITIEKENISNLNSLIFGGTSDNFDIQVIYKDGRKIVVESKSDADSKLQKLNSALRRHLPESLINLPEGFGQWVVNYDSTFNVKLFQNNYENIFRVMINSALQEWDYRMNYPQLKSAETLKRYGIIRFRSMADNERNFAYILPESKGGMVPEDSNHVLILIDRQLNNAKNKNSFKRLSNSSAELRVLSLTVGSLTEVEVTMRMSFHPFELPTEKPHLPDFIDEVWINSQFIFSGKIYTWRFSKRSGWSLHGVPFDPGLSALLAGDFEYLTFLTK